MKRRLAKKRVQQAEAALAAERLRRIAAERSDERTRVQLSQMEAVMFRAFENAFRTVLNKASGSPPYQVALRYKERLVFRPSDASSMAASRSIPSVLLDPQQVWAVWILMGHQLNGAIRVPYSLADEPGKIILDYP